MRETLYLCGGGNPEGVRLALAVQAVSSRWQRLVLLDDDPRKWGRTQLGVEVQGGFQLLGEVSPDQARVVSLVARTTARRASARARICVFGVPFTSLLSPQVDTLGAELADDVIVYPNATIGPEVAIAAGCVVFMGAVIGHESLVGPGCIVAANAVLNARVELSEQVYVGTNATVLPEVKVGAGATIAAGSVVFEDVPAGATAIGVPARIVTRDGLSGEARGGGLHPPHRSASMLERELRGIWTELLGTPVRDADLDTNFFDLGGSSLLALRMRERIERDLGIRLELIELFRVPTLRALSVRLSERPGEAPDAASRRGALRRQAIERLHGPRAAL